MDIQEQEAYRTPNKHDQKELHLGILQSNCQKNETGIRSKMATRWRKQTA
jgi:hypothetical protein